MRQGDEKERQTEDGWEAVRIDASMGSTVT
jgi:hypothetical protein